MTDDVTYINTELSANLQKGMIKTIRETDYATFTRLLLYFSLNSLTLIISKARQACLEYCNGGIYTTSPIRIGNPDKANNIVLNAYMWIMIYFELTTQWQL